MSLIKINKDNLKHYYRIRRINILSSKVFIEVRRVVEKDVAEFFYSLNDILLKDDSEFGKLVYQAYLELIKVIKKYEQWYIQKVKLLNLSLNR